MAFLRSMQVAVSVCTVLTAAVLHAESVTTEIVDSNGKQLGNVVFEDSQYGLLIKPSLQGLPSGLHGFHIHQFPNCGDKGMSAGGHLDPANTNSHQGPYGNGHLGDLPLLAVDSSGQASTPVLAPRLSTKDIRDHALMIHEGGDNYSDTPPLGGGGSRIGCGKIPA